MKQQPFIFMPDMGQVLRLTHQGKDHLFEILNEEPLSAVTAEIRVRLGEETFVLNREGAGWVAPEGPEMLPAIAKAIALRYRI